MGDRFKDWEYPAIEEEKPTKYNWVVQNKDGLRLGYRTDIGAFTYINAKFGVTIEEEVQIGSHCSIYPVSTIDGKEGPVVLKKGCRIGTHSTVMPGVTVGENAIVGAHSFVNKDVADVTLSVFLLWLVVLFVKRLKANHNDPVFLSLFSVFILLVLEFSKSYDFYAGISLIVVSILSMKHLEQKTGM